MKISMKRYLLTRLPLIVLPLGLLFSPQSSAEELHHWVSHEDGFYENNEAWVPSAMPSGLEDVALFGQQTHLTIGLLSDKSIQELQFANKTNVTFKPAGSVEAGQRGDNKVFSVQNATVDDAFFRLHSVGSDNADVILDVEDTVNVNGNVHVVNGARISTREFNLGTNPALPSTAWISGVDSATSASKVIANTITVGSGPRSTLSVANGGAVDSHIAYIGRNATNNADHMGVGEVNGQASVWDANAMVVGSKAQGHLEATSGGVVNANSIVFGTGPTAEPEDLGVGSGSVIGSAEDGSPSTMNVDQMVVGVRGSGSFNVRDGGRLNTREALLARTPAAVADVDLYSRDHDKISQWVSTGDVAIGGDLEEVGGAATVRIRENSIAELQGETIVWPGSELSVEGGTLAANRVSVPAGGMLTITDGIFQVNEYEGSDLLQRGGTIAPGPGANTSIILSDFSQRGGAKSLFEIGGTEAGDSHDRLAIDGSAVIDGLLQLDLIDGFVPSAEETFPVLGANLLFGVYQNVSNGGRVATEDGNGSFIVNYGLQSSFDPNQVVLSDYLGVIFGDFNSDGILTAADIDMLQDGVKDDAFDLTGDGQVDASDRVHWIEEAAGTVLGDTNLDRRVDFSDFLALSDSFGKEGGWAEGDFDGNGQIEFPDFLALSANFGATQAASAEAASVPEPTAAFTIVVGLTMLSCVRRKR